MTVREAAIDAVESLIEHLKAIGRSEEDIAPYRAALAWLEAMRELPLTKAAADA